jgi:hypothetical protein
VDAAPASHLALEAIRELDELRHVILHLGRTLADRDGVVEGDVVDRLVLLPLRLQHIELRVQARLDLRVPLTSSSHLGAERQDERFTRRLLIDRAVREAGEEVVAGEEGKNGGLAHDTPLKER